MEKTLELKMRGDKRKNPEIMKFRVLTTEDILNGNKDAFGYLRLGDLFTIDRNGNAANVRQNGKVKTWKRDKTRWELPLKYGLYECFTIKSDSYKDDLLVEVYE
jgi:hypothetical protein